MVEVIILLGSCFSKSEVIKMQQEQIVQKVDENLYSRQLAVYGAETQAQLIKMKCFLHGLRGLGIEIAKNLVLAGPGSITIYDPEFVTVSDLGSNFYTTHKNVGKNTRAEASITQLQELNPYVNVVHQIQKPTLEQLGDYDVVIVTDVWDKKYLIEVSDYVHSKGHGFIYGHVSGIFGSCFVDFGENFMLKDATGEEVKQAIVAGITQEQQGLVSTHEDKRHGFMDGDYVTFREVEGMSQVNEQIYQIETKSPHTFTINIDTRNFNAYQREGIVEQVKVPKKLTFKSFAASLTHPYAPDRNDMDLCDWEKIGRPELLHQVFNGLLEYSIQNGKIPELNNEEQANKFIEIVKHLNDSDRGEGALKADIDESVIKNCVLFARAQISPVVSFWGGIISQEVVKYTGKFTPLRQWLHCDFIESLPEQQVNRQTQNSQYDDLIAIFGLETLQAIHSTSAFMIGAGALGCEYVKMLALMGLGANGKGVIVTDDDNIEVSNLNRQFLFRKGNVGSNKSQVACGVGRQMNPSVKFIDKALRVGKENEEVFDDNFWENLDIVINAVDNVNARRYIDDQCCYYGKPLFESGTLGTKCNSQLIIPFKTQSYSESQDPPEESIPLCTLKNFPYQIEHTIQWARDYFQGVFADGSMECIKYLEDPAGYIKRANSELKTQPGVLRPRLETIKKYVDAYFVKTYEKCIELARGMFQDEFNNKIQQLLFCFPPDHRTEEGQLFWSNPKRPPTPIEFDENDKEHLNFVVSAANIFAFIFGIPYNKDTEYIGKKAKEFKPNVYVKPQKQLSKEEEEKKSQNDDDETMIKNLSDELQRLSLNKQSVKLNEVAFEKDDPTNWHIEFVAAVANLRARNYKIPEVPAFKVKLIAGKIIPALATTTAMIIGQVGMEIIKYILKKDISKMRNSFMNLALPLFLFSEPLPPGEHQDQEMSIIYFGPVKSVPSKWTAWDRINIKGPLTFNQFIQYFDKHYGVEVSSITVGKYMLFSSYPPPKKEFLELEIADAFTKKFGPIPHFKKFLDLVVGGDCKAEAGKEPPNADIAPVKYQLK